MSWAISHAPYGERLRLADRRLDAVERAVVQLTTTREWRAIRVLADGIRGRREFALGWAEAGQAEDVLRLAACHPRMDTDVADDVHALADAAGSAAKSRQPWAWTRTGS
ncbi:DUF7739 domain-containing protein [Actinacidiphila yeochonensis]|uniref:DUF7739 domain-containing protein n=1 Tax=Actinacidiphila yeochonensis TaxID=89050 RepID=UPI000562CA04|nr:hypothetical protein [Actinacidiphila yeochonensis]